MIEVRDLVKSHGPLRVLDGVSLQLPKGKVAVIVGPSGGGKSTLLRCINGLEKFESGEVMVGDQRMTPAGLGGEVVRAIRQRVGMVFQQFHLFPHLDVLHNVMIGPLRVLKRSRAEAEEKARRLLDRVGLGDRTQSKPAEMSGGQQQRVAIARALAVEPEAILFDEPTSALDPRMAAEVQSVIQQLAEEGQTMAVVTHAMGFAREVADTIHLMAGGRVAESAAPDEFFDSPREEVTRTFLRQARSN